MMCPGCPRRLESPGLDRDDVRGKWCGKRGRSDASLLLIGMAPGKDELLAGVPFVGGSGRMLAAALAYNGTKLDSVAAINRVNCYPLGKDEVPSEEQLVACEPRFLADLAASKATVLVPLGDVALTSLHDVKGKRQSISYWRGYTIPAGEATVQLSPYVRWIVPAYHPAFIMRGGNRAYPWLRVDLGTAVRASQGTLKRLSIPESNAPWPTAMPTRVSFDIETAGLDGDIESIAIAWED